MSPREGKFVQQFKFLRLAPEMNYELLAVALKGLQITHRPGSFLVGDQYNRLPRLAKLTDDLLAWSRAPNALTDKDVESFLNGMYEGLMTEKRGKPAHTEAYIAWCLNQLRLRLVTFNKRLAAVT